MECGVCGMEDEVDSEDDEEDVIRIRGEGEEPGREGAGEEREVKKLTDPRRPSEAEVEEHKRKNHLPYRNWCGICIKAKGKEMEHRKDAGKERGVSEYSYDYAFPGDEF